MSYKSRHNKSELVFVGADQPVAAIKKISQTKTVRELTSKYKVLNSNVNVNNSEVTDFKFDDNLNVSDNEYQFRVSQKLKHESPIFSTFQDYLSHHNDGSPILRERFPKFCQDLSPINFKDFETPLLLKNNQYFEISNHSFDNDYFQTQHGQSYFTEQSEESYEGRRKEGEETESLLSCHT